MVKARNTFIRMFLFLWVSCAPGQTPSRTSSDEMVFRNAQTAMEHGDVAAAVRIYRLALASAPRSASLHAGLSSALAAEGNLHDALDEQDIAVILKPSDPAMHRALASLLYKTGDLVRARGELEPLVGANPQDLASALLLGDVDVKLGRNEDVLRILAPLEPTHQNSIELEYMMAFAMIQTGNLKEGAPRMEKVAGIRKSADSWMVAGIARFEANQFHPAQADAEQALRLDNNVHGGSTLLGKTLYILGQHEAAVRPLQTALREDPSDFDANLYLATIRIEQKDYGTAEALLNLALQLRPGFPLARLDRAKLLGMMGRVAEAVPILEDLVKGKPDWQEAHWEMANDYFKIDRAADGRRERAVVERLRTESTP